jgi:hypothetical protein
MKPCDPWRQELSDYALGAVPSAALAKHLQDCLAYSAALGKWQARLRDINDGLRQLVAKEPSANGADAILAQVRSRARPRPWSSREQVAAAAIAALVILAVSLGVVSGLREKRRETDKTLLAATRISNWRSPTQDLLRSPYDTLHRTPPRLGEYFYPFKTDTLNVDHQAPREKEDENP